MTGTFNPCRQGAKFDPGGAYIRRWAPELAQVPDKSIHEPWPMPPALQRQVSCVIGRDYPAPMKIGEKLIQADHPIVAYRRRREELIAAGQQSG